eukprot:scaffold5988_cov294-Chaetoceros_neogracile.AAC.1
MTMWPPVDLRDATSVACDASTSAVTKYGSGGNGYRTSGGISYGTNVPGGNPMSGYSAYLDRRLMAYPMSRRTMTYAQMSSPNNIL